MPDNIGMAGLDFAFYP